MKRLTKSTWYEIAFIYYDDSSTATYDTAETLDEAMDKVDNIIESGEDLTEVESIFIDKWYYDGHENYRDSKFETVLYEKDEDEYYLLENKKKIVSELNKNINIPNMMITGKDNLELYNMLRLKYALKLELKGMKHSRGSAYASIKQEFNLKGNKQSVYDQFTTIINTRSNK